MDTIGSNLRRLVGQATLLLIAALAAVGIPALDVLVLGNGLRETSLTEFTQEALVLWTSLAFFLVAWRLPEQRRGALLMAAFFLCLALREMDFLFDKIFHGAWKWLVLPIVATCAWTTWRAPKATLASVLALLVQGPGLLLTAGTILLVVYSRLLGMGALWETMLADGYARSAKNFVEEGSELMAYGLVAVSSALYLAAAWAKPLRAWRQDTSPTQAHPG